MKKTRAPKLYHLNGQAVENEQIFEDFQKSEKNDRFRMGELGIYYSKGLKKYYIPLEGIDHAFNRVRQIDTHVCCGKMDFMTYSLVLKSDGEEICELISENDMAVDKTLNKIKELNPEIKIGFDRE